MIRRPPISKRTYTLVPYTTLFLSVTPLAQAGNPKPRMFRLPQAQALINRLGCNNQGLAAFVANVQKSQWRKHGGILGLNIGKNAATPDRKSTRLNSSH